MLGDRLVFDRLSPRGSLALDTTRWFACLLVLAYHLSTACLATLTPNAGLTLRLAAAFGDCGPPAVIWFFVLSGVLVGGGVVAEVRHGRFRFRRYALNRATRLYLVLVPALLLGLALDSARVTLFGYSPVPGQETSANYGVVSLLGNLLCLQTVLVPTLGSNGPLWSLACEGWYYLLFPLLLTPLMRTRTRTLRLGGFGAGLLLLGLLLTGNPRLPRLFLTWCLGAALRCCPRLSPTVARRLQPFAWLLAALAMLAYPRLLATIGGLVNLLIACSFAAALLTTLSDDRPVGYGVASLSTRLAGFSFSLYLVHVPLLHMLIALASNGHSTALGLPRDGLAGPAAMLALASVIVPAAWLFSRITEARTETVRAWIKQRRLGARAASTASRLRRPRCSPDADTADRTDRLTSRAAHAMSAPSSLTTSGFGPLSCPLADGSRSTSSITAMSAASP